MLSEVLGMDRWMLSRREFHRVAACALPSVVLGKMPELERKPKRKRLAFTKPFQADDFEELATRVKRMGFDGVELAVRPRGHIEPAKVTDELPRAVEALRAQELELGILTSSITRADQEHAETTLRTAAKLGVRRYRMGSYTWDAKRPMLEQLAGYRARLVELAALNAEIGIQGLYQNHSGAHYVGAAIWDLHRMIEDVDPGHVGVAFDLGHASVEGGLSWPNHVRLLRPHFGAIYAKDFRWEEQRVRWCAFGEGKTAASFYQGLSEAGFDGPVSLHVEFGRGKEVAWQEEAFRKDLASLDALL